VAPSIMVFFFIATPQFHFMPFPMLTRQETKMITPPPVPTLFILAIISSPGVLRSRRLSLVHQLKPNIELLLLQLLNYAGFVHCCLNFTLI
jgi:hypothetical protein